MNRGVPVRNLFSLIDSLEWTFIIHVSSLLTYSLEFCTGQGSFISDTKDSGAHNPLLRAFQTIIWAITRVFSLWTIPTIWAPRGTIWNMRNVDTQSIEKLVPCIRIQLYNSGRKRSRTSESLWLCWFPTRSDFTLDARCWPAVLQWSQTVSLHTYHYRLKIKHQICGNRALSLVDLCLAAENHRQSPSIYPSCGW